MSEPFQFSNGQRANNAKELLELCRQFPDDSSQYLVREDFEKWLAYIGEPELARYASQARQTNLEARQKLEEFVSKCKNPNKSPSTEEKLAIEQRPGNFVEAIRNFFRPKDRT